jgi:hypothetical protein
MFHVKRFGTIGAENLTKPHTASRLSTCAIAPKTGPFGRGRGEFQVLLEIAASWISVKPGFIGLCERTLTALTKRHHTLSLKASDQKTPAEETSSRMIWRTGAEGATAPETLRPTDRSGMTLWKAIFH